MTISLDSKHLAKIIWTISELNLASEVCNRDPIQSTETQELEDITELLAIQLGICNIKFERVACNHPVKQEGRPLRTYVPQYNLVVRASSNKRRNPWVFSVEYGIDPENPETDITLSVRTDIYNIPKIEADLSMMLKKYEIIKRLE